MVYCTKCGTQNPDDAVNCSNCGAPLRETPNREYRRYRYEEDMCFGGRSHIWGIIIRHLHNTHRGGESPRRKHLG